MSLQRKPTIVFCHGIWADGSCFSKVIPALQADGHEVVAVQYSLESFEEDVAMVQVTAKQPVKDIKVRKLVPELQESVLKVDRCLYTDVFRSVVSTIEIQQGILYL